MSNLKKTYFLCPNWDYHPDGPVQLGNIIISPENPAQALNGFERQPPTESSMFPATSKIGVTWSKEKLRSGTYGLWTEFLSFISGLGVDASVEHSLSLEQTFSFDSITTTEFSPTPEYLTQSMSAPAVVDYLKKSRFRKHVYMITALKIVHGAKAEAKNERSIEGQLGATLDGTPSGVPVSGGPGISGKRNDRNITSFEGSSDFVFAYRLRKVITHRSGDMSIADYTKGAMFGSEGQPTATQELPFIVEGLAAQDASAQDFGCGHADEVLDGDDHCACVWPEEEE